jgi:hypothetical protein
MTALLIVAIVIFEVALGFAVGSLFRLKDRG